MGDPQNIPVVMLAALIAQMPVLTWKEHGWPGVILGLAVAAGWKFTAWLAPHLNKLFEHFGAVLSGNVEMRYDPEKQRVIYQPVTIEPREITPRIIREEHYGDSEGFRKG